LDLKIKQNDWILSLWGDPSMFSLFCEWKDSIVHSHKENVYFIKWLSGLKGTR